MIKFKASHQNIQYKGKMNPPNSLVMKITVLIWLGDGNLSNTKIPIINIIRRWNHHQIPLVHEGKRGLWLEGRISTSSHCLKEINSRKSQMKGSLELEIVLFVECVKCCIFCRRSVWEGETSWICVNVCYSWAQWCVQAKGTWWKLGVESRSWNFMKYYQWTNLWTITKIFVPPKFTIRFVSNFN